ncbi:MAG: RdgB/HAM1 family non-canonical purine NTP pyrophosphatase [Pseudomonadota bacterium]
MRRLQRGERLVLATHNAGKLAEFRELGEPFGLDIVSAGALGLPEPDETGDSFVANARIKAEAAMEATGLPALADDSGLVVEGLGGAPGIHSARWAGPDKDFTDAMARVRQGLDAAGVFAPDRRAHFNATLVLLWPDGEEAVAEGIVEGLIVSPRGQAGFGYDPCFQPDDHARTFGEMTSEEKHGWTPGNPALSHRARAFVALAEMRFPPLG